jgi:parvulin-like peptidyl-prolyl isomerase
MKAMLKSSIFLLVFVSAFAYSSPHSSVVAKVNGDPIFEDEILQNTQTQTRDEKIRNAIQYRLIVQEAKKRGLERTPEIQVEIDKLLYKKFIQTERKARKKSFSPTESELLSYYAKMPLIRIHHLVLNRRTESEKQVAKLALEQIQKELNKGTSFEQLCSQFSQDNSSLFGGDTDFRGPHNFPEELYFKIRALSKNTVSDPVEIGNSIHLFQWFDKKPFTAAPASYLQFLQARLENEREVALLTELIKGLELKAVIEPPAVMVKTK